MTKNIINKAIKVLKIVGAGVVSASICELGYLGGRMLGNDIEYTAKTVNSKFNPTVMKKRHWYSKPEKFNTRTNKFVADMKTSKKSK